MECGAHLKVHLQLLYKINNFLFNFSENCNFVMRDLGDLGGIDYLGDMGNVGFLGI